MVITKHSRERAKERIDETLSRKEFSRMAKIAYRSGQKPSFYEGKAPHFFDYLCHKRNQQRNNLHIRVYNCHIWFWKGSHPSLVSVVPVKDAFKIELQNVEDEKNAW